MANREPIQYIEIDVDYCSLSYGTGLCTALLGTTGLRKCFNTFGTCQDKDNFTKSAKTLRFVNNRANLPKGMLAYPALHSVSAFTSTVNVAGSDPKMSAFGRRATMSATLKDFLDDDIGFDKYQTERLSGAAITGGVGYNPYDYGTFLSRLKARWPHYAGRPMRWVIGFIDNGVFTVDETRHYIITDVKGPDSSGSFTFEGKDVLALADDKKALCPKPSRGKLGAAITTGLDSFALTPAGIGAEYSASGFASIGSEVVSFTRSVDTITLTGRSLKGTVLANHSLGDSFQEAYNVEAMRIDDLIEDLLVTFAKVSPTFCPKVTKWAPEINRWMSSLLLDTIITKPTGVAQLIGELADIGISIWWNDVDQEILIMPNHPVAEEAITDISDRNNIQKIVQEDKDEDRITQVHFYVKQSDPTKDYKEKANYDQINVLIDTEAERSDAYNDTKVREVFCRWLNNGADAIVRVQALRLLKRFNKPPIHYTIHLDYSDNELRLTDVVRLDSRILTDADGFPMSRLMQVYKKEGVKAGHEFKLYCQDFQYEGRFAYIMANTATPDYDSATDAEKAFGAYFVAEATPTFSDGTPPFTFI